MLSKSHPIILFIDRFGFSLYQDTLTNIPKFNFTPDIVSNLDVVNKDQFVNLISTFIQINKIVPSSLAVILSDNVIYIKDLKTDSSNNGDHKDEVRSFLENIPFEEVLAKVIKTGNVNRVVAVNKYLVMAIINTFASKGSVVEAITPGFMYGQSANFTAGLTADNIRVILGNVDTLRLGNLLTDQEKMDSSQCLEDELKIPPVGTKSDLTGSSKKPKKLRQYMLIGVFVILIIVLVIVLLNSGDSPTPPQSSKVNNASVNQVGAPTIPPVGGPASTQALITAAPMDLKIVKIKITQSSQADEKAASLKSGLLSIGFADIVNEVSEVSIPEKSSVIFSQNIPADLRNNIIAEIKKILPEISILENQESNFTINIIIGKS